MAKETRIHFLGKRFWIQERFIQVLSNYIAQAFIDLGLSTFNSNLLDLHDDCTINISGNNTGMVNLLLEVSITNENDKTSFINVLQNAKASILLIGSEIPISTLNQFESNKETVETRHFWTTPIQTQSLATTIDYIIALLDGTFPYANIGINYSGFPSGNSQEIII